MVSPNPGTAGQSVTLVSSVTHMQGNAVPTGTVSFYSEGKLLAMAGLNGSGTGQAEVQTTGVAAGKYPVTAAYSGDENYSPSTSSAFTENLEAETIDTTTTLSATPNPAAAGDTVTLTATVEAASGGPPTNGRVDFLYQGRVVGYSYVNGAGVATYSTGTSGLGAGSYPITARYKGIAPWYPSNSPAQGVEVR